MDYKKSNLYLRNGAVFISDSHYPNFGIELLEILEAILSKKLSTSQLILMGDIFDLLFGVGKYIQTFSEEGIKLLNSVSEEIEVIYLEGNHDFSISNIFPKVTVYPRELQPVEMRLGDKKVFMSHGDKFEVGFIYEVYSYLIRSKTVLNCLRILEKFIIDKNIKRLKSKNICREFKDFQKRVDKIVSKYPKSADLIVEGHYHQGLKVGKYISLPSLACQKKIAKVENGEIIFLDFKNLIAKTLLLIINLI